jgi:tripartite-type tricarboxylate transporter receptor subunit TctC
MEILMKKLSQLSCLIFGVTVLLSPVLSYAQSSPQIYPNKAIKWIVPYPPGGGSDVTARLIAGAMSKSMGQQIVIENKPGAGTQIGAQAVATSAPDGYTIGTADSGTLAYNPSLYQKLSYDANKSFAFVAGFARMPLVLVTKPDWKIGSLSEFVTAATKPGAKLSYASAGAGSPQHVGMEMLLDRTKAKIEHVAYKGAAPALQDVISGQVDAMLLDLPGGMAMMKAGRVNLVAVAMPKRVPQLPNVPTMSEAGLANFVAFAWQGMIAPQGTPPEIVKRLQVELYKALEDPEVRKKLDDSGIDPMPMDSKEFAAYVKSEQDIWSPIIKAARITLD